MIDPKLFPAAMMVMQIAAGVVYIAHGDWRKATYWGAAAVLTFAVTW